MLRLLSDAANWLLGPEKPREGGSAHLWARWIFLRWLGFIYFSAFYALLFQIKGLIGPDGLLPASDYLSAVAQAFPQSKYNFAPTLFWLASNDRALMAVMWVGLIASVLTFLNLWPRASLLACFICFVSFVSAAQDFSGYQSDGMLLAAGFISLFFVPPGLRPGLGRAHPPSRTSLFLLRWEWFRIYFESGVAKWMGGDPSWRNFTAMDQYYQNGPLPTKVRELIDKASEGRVPQAAPATDWRVRWRKWVAPARMAFAGLCLGVVLFVTAGKLLEELAPLTFRMPEYPAAWIEQFRIANDYHLFGTMTPNREEIEFQGTRDGKTWIPYKFRYKPQDLNKPPGIYAPYQPRFDWNLWFASLGSWPEYRFVVFAEERLVENDPDVLALFAGNPFPGAPPIEVRTVIYQYWFASMKTKRETGDWWRRELLGQYAPALEREPDGSIQLLPMTSMPLQNGEATP